MNERIKSLIERAEYQAKKESGYEDWEVYVPPDSQVVFEKFAELIVKECMEVVKRNIYGPCGEYDYSYSDEKYAADSRAENIYDEIKQHFGVEE